MNGMFAFNLSVFLTMQVLAQAAMKVGSAGAVLRSRRWWLGFVSANVVGAPSTLFLRQLYVAMPDDPNTVVVLAMSGTFIFSQLIFALVFGLRLRPVQWLAVGMLAVGATMAFYCTSNNV